MSAPEVQGDGSYSHKPVDAHVHLVGNGSGGTGCWLRLRSWQRPLAELMLRQVGLPRSAVKGDLEVLYIQRLLELVRTSSLGAVVILAQEQVHDDEGNPLPDEGAIYVPNEFVLNLARKHPELLAAVSI